MKASRSLPYRTLTAIALVMGLGAASPALAQEEAALDADENGEITEEEWGAYGESFGEYDADQSGFIDEEEYGTWAEAEGVEDEEGELFGACAGDDEQIAEDEWFGDETFGEYDEDESGAIEDDEWF